MVERAKNVNIQSLLKMFEYQIKLLHPSIEEESQITSLDEQETM